MKKKHKDSKLKSSRKPLGIFIKVNLMISLPILCIVSILLFSIISMKKNDYLKRIKTEGISLAKIISSVVSNAIFLGDYEFLTRHNLKIVNSREDILYVIYLQENNKSLIYTKSGWRELELNDSISKQLEMKEEESFIRYYSEIVSNDVLEAIVPIKFGDTRKGIIRLGFSIKPLQTFLSELYTGIILLGILFLTITLVGATLLAKGFTKPIITLTEAAKKVSAGDLTQSVPIFTKDEIGELTKTFNTMTKNLRETTVSKEYLDQKNIELGESLNKLHQMQDRVVIQEKMASIGTLTAGIAHEIKNPLNFVNNFAEVSEELLDELIKLKYSTTDNNNNEEFKEITSMLSQNLSKILEHGKRADSIIQGMLLVSRGKSGALVPTDINALISQYINIAYHGMRAKDPTFNILIETLFDEKIKLINVMPQNISRVILNLVNNAFYSTNEKCNKNPDFNPKLLVRTRETKEYVEINIWDNGTGISDFNKKYIFTPFFTTKPPGEGTGLGLSISYDIIVQEHEGEMIVHSKYKSYAEFTIKLPKKLLER